MAIGASGQQNRRRDMGLTMKERKTVTKAPAKQYRRATKKGKGRLTLNRTDVATGWTEQHAAPTKARVTCSMRCTTPGPTSMSMRRRGFPESATSPRSSTNRPRAWPCRFRRWTSATSASRQPSRERPSRKATSTPPTRNTDRRSGGSPHPVEERGRIRGSPRCPVGPLMARSGTQSAYVIPAWRFSLACCLYVWHLQRFCCGTTQSRGVLVANTPFAPGWYAAPVRGGVADAEARGAELSQERIVTG